MYCAWTCAYMRFGCVLGADADRESSFACLGPCADADLYVYGAAKTCTW